MLRQNSLSLVWILLVACGNVTGAESQPQSELRMPDGIAPESSTSVLRASVPPDPWVAMDATIQADPDLQSPEETDPASEDAEEEDSEEEFEEQEAEEPAPTLLGPKWHTVGPISGEYVYTGEFFNNARGGVSTKDATRYRGNLDVILTCDLDRMAGLKDGLLFVYGQEAHGKGITGDYVGDFQTLSNLDAPPLTQLSEYWWLQPFADGLLAFKVGKQDANADFCALDSAASFIGSSFGFIPTIPLPSFPHPALGSALYVTPTETLWFGAGVFDGSPNGETSGFEDLGSDGAFSIYEAIWRPAFHDGRFAGGYHAGIWHHSGEFEAIADGTPHHGNWGWYLANEQFLWHESEEIGDDQGLAAFIQYGWAPSEWNVVDEYFGAGLLYKGPIPNRDDDYVGIGVASASFSPDLLSPNVLQVQTVRRGSTHTLVAPQGFGDPGSVSETVVELFYIYQVSPWMQLQPDIQYIASPSGTESDAFAVGLRFQVAL